MSNHSNTSDQGRRKSNNKTWSDGNYEQSIHLRDIFGSQHSYEDDPSVHQRKSLEQSVSSFASEGGNTATTRDSTHREGASVASATKKPESPQKQLRHRKQPAVERIRRPIRTMNSSGGSSQGEGTTAAASAASSGPQPRLSSEKSIRLKDVFGSQFSFEDDRTAHKRKSTESVESSTLVEEEATGSPQGKVRQRKPAAERIRRPNRSNNSSGPQESTTSSSIQATNRTPRRSKSNSTIHKVLSEDSRDGIPLEKLGDSSHRKRSSTPQRARDHTSAVASGLVSVGSLVSDDDEEGENQPLSKAEEGNNNNNINSSSHHTATNHDESQVSFFEDEPLSSSKHSLSRTSHTNPPLAQPLVAKRAFKTEPPKRTWCISCGIFLGLMGVFLVTQAFSLLIWKPEPILLTEEIPTPPQSVQTTTTSSAANTLQAPPEAEFEAAEEGILGHLSEETLHRINQDEESPQATALRWFHADPHWETYTPQRRQQRFALATLYFATNPPYEHQWNNAGHWLSYDVSECAWLTSQDDRNLCQSQRDHEKEMVTSLPLAGNNLKGQLPPELSLLTRLASIDLRRNEGLTGQLPERWCGVPDLFYDCAIQSALTRTGVCGCGQCDC